MNLGYVLPGNENLGFLIYEMGMAAPALAPPDGGEKTAWQHTYRAFSLVAVVTVAPSRP